MLYCNLFRDGGHLVESEPQGEASCVVNLPQECEQILAELLTPEVSQALARLYLAGVVAGERAARKGPVWPLAVGKAQ